MSDRWQIKANLGFVLRGSMDGLNKISDVLEDLCPDYDVKIAYKTASASRLWIKEDVE